MDFNKDVIERSYEQPVVVDFWAPWCGPCKVLGPVIEQLAEEQKDQWDLVKVNTEEEYDLSVQYQIRSIPNVKMFHKGEVIAEFMGALPRMQIIKWLGEHLPSADKEAIAILIENLKSGNTSEEELLQIENTIQQNPEASEARIALAQYYVFRQPKKATDLVAAVKLGDKESSEAQDIKELARLMTLNGQEDGPVTAKIKAAQNSFQQGELETGIQELIDAASMDKSYLDDLPRKAAIAFFRILGNQHPLTKNYRWKFDMALY